MYACIHEIGGEFFEGVCAPSNASAHSYDPPPPPLDSPPALCQRCSKSNMGVYIRAFYFLVPHQPSGECGLQREISKRLTMWHMKHTHVADVSTLATH
jgi:hypothetical protein